MVTAARRRAQPIFRRTAGTAPRIGSTSSGPAGHRRARRGVPPPCWPLSPSPPAVAAPASARDEAAAVPGRAGHRRPLLPARRQRRHRRRCSTTVHDRYRFVRGRLSGWTRLTVRATEDLSPLRPRLPAAGARVHVDGRPATFSRPAATSCGSSAATPLRGGQTVRGCGSRTPAGPAGSATRGESNWLADATEVVAMNEPHMAPWWFPANDHPLDKARMDIHVTVPRGQAGGRQRRAWSPHGRTATGRRTHWRAGEPMAPYLAFFAAGHFAVRQGAHDGLPWLRRGVAGSCPPSARARRCG